MIVRECTKCPLHESRTKIVNPFGNLSRPSILFVGEAPGQQEDQAGRPFVGLSGHLLATAVRLLGIPTDEVAMTNAVRCHPPANRTPKAKEIEACNEYLWQDIEDIDPKVIVTLGGKALQAVYKNVSVESVLAQTIEHRGRIIVPTYHPSWFMKGNWRKVSTLFVALKKAWRIAREGYERPTVNVEVVRTPEDARRVKDLLLAAEHLAFDTETTGLDFLEDELICIQFSPIAGQAYVFPVLMNDGEELVPAWDSQTWWSDICPTIADILGSDVPKTAQNALFDIAFLEREPDPVAVHVKTAYGWRVRNVLIDTQQLALLVDENLPANLTHLTAFFTDLPYYEEELRKQSKNYRAMEKVENEVLWTYGGYDVDVLQRITPTLIEEVERQGMLWCYSRLQRPLIAAVRDISKRGVLVDVQYLQNLQRHYEAERAKLEEALDRITGGKIERNKDGRLKYKDWRSKQRILFDICGLPLPKEATKGALDCKECNDDYTCPEHVSTSKKVLEQLFRETEHEVIPVLLSLNKVNKIESTYVRGYAKWVRDDNRIYPKWSLRTSTGRLSCSEPNLQNIPRGEVVESQGDGMDIKEQSAIRRMFIAPPGKVIMTADWNQVEVWSMAYRTQDPVLLDLLLSGKDVHTHVARQLGKMGISPLFPDVGEDLDDVEWALEHKEIRSRAKVFTFGISYGLTAEGAAERLGCSPAEAKRLLDAFLEILPSLPDYFDEIRNTVLAEPYMVRTWSGRARHFPQVPLLQALSKVSRRFWHELEAVVREAYNLPIQGGAHDLHIAAWVTLSKDENILQRAVPILETHDSLTFEANAPDEEYVVQTAWMIKNLFERVAKDFPTPEGKRLGWEVPVEVEWGDSLGTPAKKLTARGELIDLAS